MCFLEPRLISTTFDTNSTTNVDLVTIRESTHHRRWPSEIVEAFLAAEVQQPLSTHSTSPRYVVNPQNRQELR